MNPLELIPIGSSFTESEKVRFLEKLWNLLARQAALYTMDESTSLPTETARELLASICCTLQFELDFSHLPVSTLAEQDLNQMLRNGQAHLSEKRKRLKALWLKSYTAAKRLGKQDIMDELLRIEPFFSKYDLYFSAHKTPRIKGFFLRKDSLYADVSHLETYLSGLLNSDLT